MKEIVAQQRLGFWGFVTISYFLVCGGPFGIEFLVIHGGKCVSFAAGKQSGPLWALAGFIAIPLMWSIPQALMTVEMSLSFPQNGGYIVWVEVSCSNPPTHRDLSKPYW